LKQILNAVGIPGKEGSGTSRVKLGSELVECGAVSIYDPKDSYGPAQSRTEFNPPSNRLGTAAIALSKTTDEYSLVKLVSWPRVSKQGKENVHIGLSFQINHALSGGGLKICGQAVR
jgi:hypothetical protein